MGYSVHRMPQVGEVIPGLWLASAFGGHGLNTTAMAGALIARAITEGDDRWRLFLPYELVWAGGTVGRAVRRGSTWTRGGQDDPSAPLPPRRAGEHQRQNSAARIATPPPPPSQPRPQRPT